MVPLFALHAVLMVKSLEAGAAYVVYVLQIVAHLEDLLADLALAINGFRELVLQLLVLIAVGLSKLHQVQCSLLVVPVLDRDVCFEQFIISRYCV